MKFDWDNALRGAVGMPLEEDFSQSILTRPPQNRAMGPVPRLPTNLSPAMGLTESAVGAESFASPTAAMTLDTPTVLPRITDAFESPTADAPDDDGGFADAYNTRLRALAGGRSRWTRDDATRARQQATREATEQTGLARDKLESQARIAQDKTQATRQHNELMAALGGRRLDQGDERLGQGRARIDIQRGMLGLRQQHEQFYQQLGLRGQEFKEIAERVSVSQRERGLDIQAAAEENRAIQEAARQAKERGEAIPWANGLLAKLRYSVTGTQPGVMRELSAVPRPNLGIKSTTAAFPSPSVPLPEVNVPMARAPVQPGAQQEKAGPIGSDNEANVARRLYGDVSETALKKAHDLLVDAAAGNARAKDILAGKIKRKAR